MDKSTGKQGKQLAAGAQDTQVVYRQEAAALASKICSDINTAWCAQDMALLSALMMKLRRNASELELAGRMVESDALDATVITRRAESVSLVVLTHHTPR